MTLVVEGAGRSVDGQIHLQDIHLQLHPGRLHVLYGRTLAGKTSLLRLLAGLDRPHQGRVLDEDRDTARLRLQERQVAFVYEQFVNYPSFSVARNIATPLERQGLDRATIDRRVQEVASMLRIGHLLDRLPGQLSGGQQQRVAIARALAKRARLLLLDEPLVNLDYKLREDMRGELRQLLSAAQDTVVVYTTTDPHEALQMGGDISVLHEGRLLQTGGAEDIWHRPADATVAQVFSDPPMNLVDAHLAGDRLHVGEPHQGGVSLPRPAHLARLPDGPCRIGQRATDLRFGPHIGPASVAGEVTLAEVNGAETFVHVQGGHHRWVLQVEGVHPLAMGTPLAVHLEPAQMLAFAPEGRLLATPDQRAAGSLMH